MAYYQFLQIIISYIHRKENIDTTGDPWNGRTLEWSTSSPPPLFNFAILPEVSDRDAFWVMKQKGVDVSKKYEDIEIVKNSPIGMFIGASACLFGFAAVWHIWWLLIISFIAVIVFVMIRTTDENTDYILSASEVENLDKQSMGDIRWKI